MMNFSQETKENVKKLIRYNIEDGDSDRNVGRWDDTYHDMRDSSKLKRGRFGIVYSAFRLRELDEVAIKEIVLDFKTDYTTPGLSRHSHSVKNDTAATMDFLMACQEAVLQSSKEFRHSNIVQCYDSWIKMPQEKTYERLDPEKLIEFIEDETQLTAEIKRNLELIKGMKFFIVMELYEENLEEKYSTAAPGRDVTKDIIHQIASALQFIHSKGYVHRDLKPRNILISGTKVAVGDFGLCKRVEEHEEIKGKTGTPPYNTSTDIYLTPKWDIWSLGIIVFELFFISDSEPRPSETQIDRALTKLVETARGGNMERLKEYVGPKVKAKAMKSVVAACLRSASDRPSADDILQMTGLVSSKMVPQGAVAQSAVAQSAVAQGPADVVSEFVPQGAVAQSAVAQSAVAQGPADVVSEVVSQGAELLPTVLDLHDD